MKNKLTLIFAILLLGLSAQPPLKFYVVYGGSGDDMAYDIKQTLDKGYILTGSSSSEGNGQTDLYLLKLNALGQKVWEKYIGGFANEVGRSIELLPDSGFAICGYTSSFGNGGYDLYLLKTDKFGNVVWQRTVGGNDWDFGQGVAVSQAGEIFCAGYTYTNGSQDVLLAKFDGSGNKIWEKNYGGALDDAAYSLYTANGTVFCAAGITKSKGEPNGDMYLLTFNGNGDTLYTKTYGHSGEDYANDVISDPGGNVIMVGTMTYSSTGHDAVSVKFDNAGNFAWEKKEANVYVDDEEIFSITKATYTTNWEHVAVQSCHEIVGYGEDTKTIYLNINGDFWAGWGSGSFGFPKEDRIVAISTTADAGFISCGFTTSFTGSTGNKDILIIRRDSLMDKGTSIVGLQEENRQTVSGMLLYPNPVKYTEAGAKVSLKDPMHRVTGIKVYNMLSQELEVSFSVENLIHELSMPGPGIYIIHVLTATGTLVTKIIVE